MINRLAFVAALAASASPLAAQPPAPTPATGSVNVALDTNRGRIVVALDPVHAPITTANFLHYVDSGRYNGISFYRAMKTDDGGLVQAGITADARKMFAPIAHESTSQTGLKNVAGAIAMANSGAGTARSDFFIELSDFPSLDATATDPGFAVFGHVVEGLDVAKAILGAPTSATKGEGVMRGQMLDPVVTIAKASRVKP